MPRQGLFTHDWNCTKCYIKNLFCHTEPTIHAQCKWCNHPYTSVAKGTYNSPKENQQELNLQQFDKALDESFENISIVKLDERLKQLERQIIHLTGAKNKLEKTVSFLEESLTDLLETLKKG